LSLKIFFLDSGILKVGFIERGKEMGDGGSSEFESLIARVRQGDEEATAKLVNEFGPIVERHLRAKLRLQDARLRQTVDAAELCQSVMLNLFFRLSVGEYELSDPEQLRNLVFGIARHKLVDAIRKFTSQKRDVRRQTLQEEEHESPEIGGSSPGPMTYLANRELIQRAHQLLTAEERRIVDLRRDGSTWDQIAEELGGTPESNRKRYSRAVERVATELDLLASAD
jgi:RNA polymerase sigma factor (sigma-70 family)